MLSNRERLSVTHSTGKLLFDNSCSATREVKYVELSQAFDSAKASAAIVDLTTRLILFDDHCNGAASLLSERKITLPP